MTLIPPPLVAQTAVAPRAARLLPQFLICGLEHSGTTLLSDLFRQVPGLDSGFEGGVLLCERPADFLQAEPFARHILDGWGLTQDELAQACAAPDFAGFYGALTARARAIAPDTTQIFDKTPRYLADLAAVLGRHSTQVLLCHRDPRGLVWSDFMRAVAGGGVVDFDPWYSGYRGPKLAYLRRAYDQYLRLSPDPRVMAIGLEAMVLSPRAVAEAAFGHVGQPFDLSYLVLPPARYGQVRGRGISTDHALAHLRDMPAPAQTAVMRDFADARGGFMTERAGQTSLCLNGAPAGRVFTAVCLGTPRGGTSMVAGVMAALGLPMGDDLGVNIEDAAFNPDHRQGDYAGFLRDLPTAIAARNRLHRAWGWKYPHAARYLPDIEGLLREPRLIVVLRDPLPSTLRALRGKGFDAARALSVLRERERWQKRNLALVETLGWPCLLVSFEKAMAQPATFVNELAGFLHLPLPGDGEMGVIAGFMARGGYKPAPLAISQIAAG